MLFLGHLHPLLVHLPIGGLVLLAFLEVASRATGRKQPVQNGAWILAFVSLSSIGAAGCGWILAQAGGYESSLLQWHRVTGFAFAAACLITLVLRYSERVQGYRIALLSSVLLLAFTGHLGGSITHGRDFLTRFAPSALREMFCDPTTRNNPTEFGGGPIQQPVFAGVVQPILRQRCTECHGAEKHKGDLRLDSLEALMRGGQDGTAIKAGQANNSPLIQCMLSTLDADGHMPPEDQPQPSREEITLLEWWINKGAPASGKVSDLNPDPEIRRLVENLSKRNEFAQ